MCYLGVSNFAAWQLTQTIGVTNLHGWTSISCLQPQYSLIG